MSLSPCLFVLNEAKNQENYPETDLYSFLELDAEVLKDAEALVQLEGVLVLAKEIDESVPLFTQIQPASLQVLKGPS